MNENNQPIETTNREYSVLMSVYFKETAANFSRSIESVLAQTVKPSEFVIVCDGQLTDELNAVITKYTELYPTLFNIVRLEKNSGLGNALNVGISNVRHTIVMRMDSDDICMPLRASIELPLMEKYDLVGGAISEFDGEETNIIGYRRPPLDYKKIRKFAKTRSPFNHPSVMYKKDVILQAGNYQTCLYVEDHLLWIKVLKVTNKVCNVPDILVNMRSGKQMRARRSGKVYRASLRFLRKFMLHIKFINVFEYCWISVVQSLFVLTPVKLKSKLYTLFLRK